MSCLAIFIFPIFFVRVNLCVPFPTFIRLFLVWRLARFLSLRILYVFILSLTIAFSLSMRSYHLLDARSSRTIAAAAYNFFFFLLSLVYIAHFPACFWWSHVTLQSSSSLQRASFLAPLHHCTPISAGLIPPSTPLLSSALDVNVRENADITIHSFFCLCRFWWKYGGEELCSD